MTLYHLQTYHQIMKLMYEIILATDLAHHLASLKDIRKMIKSLLNYLFINNVINYVN